MKIAEALLLRKQLDQKVKQLEPLRVQGDNGLFEMKIKRVNAGDNIDEAQIQIPRITLKDVTATFDHYASQLRKIDTAIQKANWQFDIDFTEEDAPVAPVTPQVVTPATTDVVAPK